MSDLICYPQHEIENFLNKKFVGIQKQQSSKSKQKQHKNKRRHQRQKNKSSSKPDLNKSIIYPKKHKKTRTRRNPQLEITFEKSGTPKKHIGDHNKTGIFPVGRLHRYLKKKGDRVSRSAGVYMSSVLQLLTRSVFQKINSETMKGRKRLTPDILKNIFQSDENLSSAINDPYFICN